MLNFSELDITEEEGELSGKYEFVGKEEEGVLDQIDFNESLNLNEGENEESEERKSDGKRDEEENEETEKNEVTQTPPAQKNPKSKGLEFSERLSNLRSENSKYRAELHEKKSKILELENSVSLLQRNIEEMKEEMEGYKKLSSFVYKNISDEGQSPYRDEDEMIQKVTGHAFNRKPQNNAKNNVYTEEQVAELTRKKVEEELGKKRKIIEIESKWKAPIQHLNPEIKEELKTYMKIYENEDFFLDDLYYLSDKDYAPQTLVLAYKEAEKQNIDLSKVPFIEKARFFDKVNKHVKGKISNSQSKQTASKPITQNKSTKLDGNKNSGYSQEEKEAWIKHFTRLGRPIPEELK